MKYYRNCDSVNAKVSKYEFTVEEGNVSLLVKATMKFLEISTDNIDNSTSESRTVKAILGNLHGVAGNIAELRNAYGSGYGKSASYKGLIVRHAKLVIVYMCLEIYHRKLFYRDSFTLSN